MAKRMKFSVIGLPHYTIWHLYEPSVDDIRHMEEMEQERQNREREEKERAERIKKIKDEFHEPNTQWEKDKSEVKGIAQKEEEKAHTERIAHVGDERGPIAQPAKETADVDTQASVGAAVEAREAKKSAVGPTSVERGSAEDGAETEGRKKNRGRGERREVLF